MRARTKKEREQQEYYTVERCHMLEVSNSEDDPNLSIAKARVAPGIITEKHLLKGVAERYIITSGYGLMTIDKKSFAVGKGDIVIIPPDTPQQILNTGEDDLLFYCICTPRFTPSCYVPIQESDGPGAG